MAELLAICWIQDAAPYLLTYLLTDFIKYRKYRTVKLRGT